MYMYPVLEPRVRETSSTVVGLAETSSENHRKELKAKKRVGVKVVRRRNLNSGRETRALQKISGKRLRELRHESEAINKIKYLAPKKNPINKRLSGAGRKDKFAGSKF